MCVRLRVSLMNVCVCGFRGWADARRPRVRCLALWDVFGTDEPLQFWQHRVSDAQPGMTSSPSGREERRAGPCVIKTQSF